MFPKITTTPNYGIAKQLIVILMVSFISGMFSAGMAQSCEEELNEAEQRYNRGRFDEAINLIGKCLETPGVSEEEKKRAYRLLGLTYIAKDYLEEAKTAVKRLLEVVPSYEADAAQDPPTFSNLIDEVRREMAVKKEQAQPPKPVSTERPGGTITRPPVYQSSPVKFGFRGGLNLANISEDFAGTETLYLDDDTPIDVTWDQGMRNTFGAGAFIEVWVNPTFALQFNALYSMKGVKTEGSFDEDIVFEGVPVNVSGELEDVTKLAYLSFPVLAKLAFGERGALRPYLIFGPEIGILLSAEEAVSGSVTTTADRKTTTKSFSESEDIKEDLESVEFALSFGGGFTIPLGSMELFIDGMYGLGLSKINKKGDESIKNNVIYVNLGLIFGQ